MEDVRARARALGIAAPRAVRQDDHRLMKGNRVGLVGVAERAERVLRHVLDLREERAVAVRATGSST